MNNSKAVPKKNTSKIQCGLITFRGKSLQQPQNMGTCTTTLWTNLNVFFLLDNLKSGLQNTRKLPFVEHTHHFDLDYVPAVYHSGLDSLKDNTTTSL